MEREARRKKIKSREMDRMALITGRTNNLDPDLPKSSSFSISQTDHSPPAQHSRSSSEPAVADNDKAYFQNYDLHGGDSAPDTVTMHDNDEEIYEDYASEFQNQEQTALIAKTDDANFHEKPFEYHLSSINPREIHFSIVSSEITRAICSFVIAVLVVLSHINLPHKVIKSKSLIAYRPLYAVILTDMLIVAARLALFSQGKEDEKKMKFEENLQSWNGAVKLLEWGLVMHQTLRGIFIDCSLYLAIVICGLSIL